MSRLAGPVPPASTPSRRAMEDRTAPASKCSPSMALVLTTSTVSVLRLLGPQVESQRRHVPKQPTLPVAHICELASQPLHVPAQPWPIG